jgi:hypothetical protein
MSNCFVFGLTSQFPATPGSTAPKEPGKADPVISAILGLSLPPPAIF